ncbi:hypothetical protein BX616_004452 [Lobosporangium transversale]|uniref:MARVEL domain-containing protein n=1 Tax=Lobosporangium transversale TaxID=64571 RepID=A0A1Y2GTG7_9FUNG|nr:hypothetical protein BCR41DRAFT_349690 [Lobosporangium transversale]KAF9898131.1 hypothetical protein BX616_004452 [Lobosporangium transversale]ORZ22790.1 hypothetical protein BCR41DRAFT_349690 [Lobosporangium transversale]|eukprot:XP_021883344.1 hypothetical protein BCR41DRAFT_349690 [Lobosporangium transversale]
MSRPKEYCCCCVPLGFGVIIICLLALVHGIFNLVTTQQGEPISLTSNVLALISGGLFLLLGLGGGYCALSKSYKRVKAFSILWWIATAVITAFNIVDFSLVSRHKEDIKLACQKELGDITYSTSLPEDCYGAVTTMLVLFLVLDMMLMLFFGHAIHLYANQLKGPDDNVNQDHPLSEIEPQHKVELPEYRP